MNFFAESQNAVMPLQHDLDFFEKVIEAGEASLNYGVLAKANEIPIIFVSEETMRRISSEYSRKLVQDEMDLKELFEEFSAEMERCNERVSREWYEKVVKDRSKRPEHYLGFYVPNNTIGQYGPAIWICYSRICGSGNTAENIRNKTLTVLIHELGHAIMAAREVGNHALNIWVEEPLANLIALRYLESARTNPGTLNIAELDNVFSDARTFVELQPRHYAVGLKLFDAEMQGIRFEWAKWRDRKYCQDQKKNELLAWRRYIQGSINLDPVRLNSLYQEIVKPLQYVQQQANNGVVNNMRNDLRALIYYVFYAVNMAPAGDRITYGQLRQRTDFIDALRPFEQGAIAALGILVQMLPLDEIFVDRETFLDILDQLEHGVQPANVSINVEFTQTQVVAQPAVSYYQNYINNIHDEKTKASVDSTINRLNEIMAGITYDGVDENGVPIREVVAPKSRANGLVVGRVQSGKTRNYIGLMLKAFEEGWNAIFVLTSNSTELRSQTAGRIAKDFAKAGIDDRCARQIDIGIANGNMHPASAMEGFLYWGVVIKETHNLGHLKNWLSESRRNLPEMRIMIIDDEADNASPNSNNGEILLEEGDIDLEIENLRTIATDNNNYAYLLPLVNWLQQLRLLPGDNAAIQVTNEILSGAAKNQKSQRDALFNDTRWCELTGADDLVRDAVYTYYKTGNKKPKFKDFLLILKSILCIVKDRAEINKQIVEIIDRARGQGEYTYNFKKCAYIAYTATPYACIFNESPNQTPIYPHFIQSLEKSKKYFGLAEIFGEADGVNLDARMPIVQRYTDDECDCVQSVKDGGRVSDDLFVEVDGGEKEMLNLKEAISYFICSAAARRIRRLRENPNPQYNSHNSDCDKNEFYSSLRDDIWTTMLINIHHTIGVMDGMKDAVKHYLANFIIRPDFMDKCHEAWTRMTAGFTENDFQNLFPDYGCRPEPYPTWNDLVPHIQYFIQDGKIQVVVLNTGTQGEIDSHRYANDGNGVPRYTDDHAWIVCGGNKISRGLTLPGLTVSYFDRLNKTIPVDTMTQMGRWFGYRGGYELLPRIWMRAANVTEMKNIAKIEELLHPSIRVNFDNHYSPADPSHYQTVYSYGRKLSGRDRSQQHVTSVMDTLVESPALPIDATDVQAVYAVVDQFACTNQPKMNRTGCQYSRIPLWADIPSQKIVNLLKGIRTHYPPKTQRMLNALIIDIESGLNTDWNVVLGVPERNVLNAPAPESFKIGTFNVVGGQPALTHVDGALKTSVSRLHIPFYADIPQSILDSTTDFYKEYFLAHPNECPAGRSLPEGFRNRSDSKFMNKVFESLPDDSKKPILQFYVIDPRNFVDGNLPAGIPLFAISVYWPDHEPDFFIANQVGYEPPARSIDSVHVFTKVQRILQDNAFPMSTAVLRDAFLRNYPVRLFSNAETVYNANVRRGRDNGYSYYKIPNKDAYAHTSWCSEDRAVEKLKQEFAVAAVEVLRQTTDHVQWSDLQNSVLATEPKWTGLIPFATNPGDFDQYIQNHPEYNIVSERNRSIYFWFNREGM